MENTNEKFLSLEWFKERVEASIDRVIEKKIDKLVAEDDSSVTKSVSYVKPYLNLKMINDSLVVVMNDGNIFTKPNATEFDYYSIKDATTEEEVLWYIEDKKVAKEVEETKKEAKKIVNTVNGFNTLKGLNDFIVDGNVVYLKGTSRTIPPLLLDKFAAVVGGYDCPDHATLEEQLLDDDEYQGLKNFFMWCCLNPRAEVADSLYDFLAKNGMKITKQGFFVALRNVVKVGNEQDDTFVQFITNAYNKVKAVLKKSPSNYCIIESEKGLELKRIYEDKEFVGRNLGNLSELYKNLPNMAENRYTDDWTKTFDIRIGRVVSMPKEKANWSTQDCATAGLHFAGHTAPYVLCGDTTVFTLHNPMKVVGIGTVKGRCWEYLPFMTTNIKEADAIMNSNDFDFLQLDEEYAINELKDLTNRVQEGFTAETSKYSFNLPSISTVEINSIVLSLSKMTEKVTKRVSIIE